MIVYIAGKITGDPNYRTKFYQAARTVEELGHTPMTSAVLPLGLTERDYMKISLDMIDAADVAVFLPDFSKSEGAMVELAYCKKTGKPVSTLKDWEETNR